FDSVQELLRRLEPILRLHGKALQNRLVQVFRNVNAALGDGYQLVMVQPLQALRRQEPRDGRVEAGGAGVHIGEWSLTAPADILLLRGITHLQDNIQAFALVADGVSCGAEVQQLYHAVLGDVDVVWGDVTMNKS